jgi:hypothetical protein
VLIIHHHHLLERIAPYWISRIWQIIVCSFVEQSFWNSLDGNELHKVIPIFVTLPQFVQQAARDDLFANVLLSLEFTFDDISSLQQMFHFVFILDGLDEVTLSMLPKDNFHSTTK